MMSPIGSQMVEKWWNKTVMDGLGISPSFNSACKPKSILAPMWASVCEVDCDRTGQDSYLAEVHDRARLTHCEIALLPGYSNSHSAEPLAEEAALLGT